MGTNKYTKIVAFLIVAALIIAGGVYWFSLPEEAGEDNQDQTTELRTEVDRGISEEDFPIFQKRIDDLIAEIDEVEAEGERDVNLILRLGNAYYTIGQLGTAVENYNEILSTNPDDTPALENKGQALIEMGDIEGAEVTLRKAISLGGQEHIYFSLAELIRENYPERTDEIKSLIEGGIESLGQTEGLLIELGNWYREEGMFEEAISHYEVAYRLSGQKPSIKRVIDELNEEWAEQIERERRINE